MKKAGVIATIVSFVVGVGAVIGLGIWGMVIDQERGVAEVVMTELPKPEVAGGLRGEMGINKNVNEATIDKYLGRTDAVYRDMRMLIDEADYEKIGGDAYLSGFVKGFEVVPFPKIVNVTGLPEAVGETYQGPTLFTEKDGKYTPNYAESMEILEYYFPKDKKIFLMCGGGGYAGMMKKMLVELGWDAEKIYNVGGYWYYDGENKVEVKRVADGKVSYDFWKVPYHEIYFEGLNKLEKFKLSEDVGKAGQLTEITASEFEKMIATRRNFIVVAHMVVCPAEFPLLDTARQYVKEAGVPVYGMVEDEFKKTAMAEVVRFLPSAVIYREGKMVDYLDAEADEDVRFYGSAQDFGEWVEKWVEL